MLIKPIFTALTRRKTQSVLLVLQLTVTFALMINSLMLALDANARLSTDTGMMLETILTISYKPNHDNYKNDAWYDSLIEQDIDDIMTLSGVKSVTFSNQLPLGKGGLSVDIHRLNQPKRSTLRAVSMFLVDTNVIETLGLSLISGRNFIAADRLAAQSNDEASPVIVTKALADALFPNSDAIGQMTSRGQIIGVVKKFHGLRSGGTDVIEYSVFSARRSLSSRATAHLLIKTDPQHLNDISGKLPELLKTNNIARNIHASKPMQKIHRQLYQQETAIAALFSILSLFMLLITLISAFIHAYHHVTQQRKILAIWRALGASQRDVMFYILGENWMMTILSVMLGVFTAYLMNTFLNHYITIAPPDLTLLLSVGLLMFIAGSLASWLPAAKAARVSPAAATRST